MTPEEFRKVVRAGTPFATGQMMDSWVFFETPYYDVAIADTNRTPYFVYNEEGTIYTQKNKGFIRNGIVGQVNRINWSENLGIPYSFEQIDNTLKKRQNSILLSMGAMEVIR